MSKPHYFIFIFVQLNKMGEDRVYQTSTMWQHGPLNWSMSLQILWCLEVLVCIREDRRWIYFICSQSLLWEKMILISYISLKEKKHPISQLL